MNIDTIAAIATALSDSGIGIVRISGPEAARQIRLSGRRDAHLIRIAAMSADPYRVGETTGPGADFDAFVPKPFSTDDLAGVLFR